MWKSKFTDLHAIDAAPARGVHHDTLIDSTQVVDWLTKSAQRMTRDRATIALARSPLKDDRAAFAAWPERRGALRLNNEAVDADLGAGKISFVVATQRDGPRPVAPPGGL